MTHPATQRQSKFPLRSSVRSVFVFALMAGLATSAIAAEKLKSNKVSNTKYGRNYGPGPKIDYLKTKFTSKGDDLLLHAQSYDIDTADEVAIELNGTVIGYLPTTDNEKKGLGTLWLLPAGMQKAGSNTVKFVRNGGDRQWGVSKLGVFNPGSSKTAFGYLKKINGDIKHPQSVRIYTPLTGDQAQIGIKFFDIDTTSEVRVSVSGRSAPQPGITANNKFGNVTHYTVPANGGWVEFSNALVTGLPLSWGIKVTDTNRAFGAINVGGFRKISDSAWDESAVRRVLHTFAWGGHARPTTIAKWAKLSPEVAIVQMLNFKHHNFLLSQPHAKDRDGLSSQPNTLASVRSYLSRSSQVPWSERFLFRDDWAMGMALATSTNLRGLNPFRNRIGIWETNYHMATNLNAGVEHHQMQRYYDTIMRSLEKNEPYQATMATAAASAAIAKQYAHYESRYYADEDFCECNEDFAREYYQLFFGILGEYDPEYHETTVVKNMSRVLTGIEVVWKNSLQREPTVPVFKSKYHYRGDLALLPGSVSADRGNAKYRLEDISNTAINHPESLRNLPVKIISGLADDNMTDAKANTIRTAWASMGEKNLLDFLRAYAISDTFHNPTRVKYWNSFDRSMIFNNGYYFTNREVFLSTWLINRYDDEDFHLFEPKHNVFGGQRGPEAARSTEVFRNVYNGSSEDLWRFGRIRESLGGLYWEKNWGSVIPKVGGRHKAKDVGEFLWNRFIGDGLKNFGDVERAHVYALLGSRFDLMQGLDSSSLNRIIGMTDMETDAKLVNYVNKMSRQEVNLTSSSRSVRDTANVRVGRAVAFITATPYALAQEGL